MRTGILEPANPSRTVAKQDQVGAKYPEWIQLLVDSLGLRSDVPSIFQVLGLGIDVGYGVF